MAQLSASYEKTLAYLEKGDTPKAIVEFRDTFTEITKKMYAECAKTYPVRFGKIDNWCNWMSYFYAKTRLAEDTIENGDKAKSFAELSALREHMNQLHLKTQTMKSNDYIYAIEQTLKTDQPDAREFSNQCATLETAALSAKATEDPRAYNKARTKWLEHANKALNDGQLDEKELKKLRAETDRFYRDFGIQFE